MMLQVIQALKPAPAPVPTTTGITVESLMEAGEMLKHLRAKSSEKTEKKTA
jgi:hypothetical protein